MRNPIRLSLLVAVLTGLLSAPLHAQHIAPQRPFKLAPSAELVYSIKARQSGISIDGEGRIVWQQEAERYSVVSDTRAMWLGKVLESKSEGAVDTFGLAPQRYVEQKVRKPAYTAEFDRAAQTIHFSDSKHSYPILGGEQDRVSVTWQLIAVARAEPKKFVAGSRWDFFVAGPHDADPWTFRVVERVTLKTALGNLPCVHLVKEQPSESKDQQVDLWLAPGLEWYPVRVRYLDNDGNAIEQFLEKVVKKPA